jgi:adenylate kinase family enzyme
MGNKKSLVIALAGPSGSGKSTIARYLEQQFGFKHLSTRKALAQMLETRGVEVNEMNLQAYGQELVDSDDLEAFCEQVVQDYKSSESYVIDSIYHLISYNYFYGNIQ